MLPVIYRSVARIEFDGSIDWYEAQRSGLGDEFESEIQKAIADIASYPKRYPIVERDVRQAPVDRFPFCIYYRIRSAPVGSSSFPSFTSPAIRANGEVASDARLPPIIDPTDDRIGEHNGVHRVAAARWRGPFRLRGRPALVGRVRRRGG